MNCPKCKTGAFGKPYKSGTKWMAKCTKCQKNIGVKRYYNSVKKIWEFEYYPLGRRSSGYVHTHRIEERWSAVLSMDELRRVLRAGKLALDKRREF